MAKRNLATVGITWLPRALFCQGWIQPPGTVKGDTRSLRRVKEHAAEQSEKVPSEPPLGSSEHPKAAGVVARTSTESVTSHKHNGKFVSRWMRCAPKSDGGGERRAVRRWRATSKVGFRHRRQLGRVCYRWHTSLDVTTGNSSGRAGEGPRCRGGAEPHADRQSEKVTPATTAAASDSAKSR
ncbi:uncharacterized protein LOC116963637 isoform X2 [Tyto alba]|uniref:uncharacterized protein LOC116963637 isoform X2 n=1 Tax=Tyto alba TaxID=56313 RepID=UPI001C6671AF|nr:uncharacterized protein LOC116963637 isoform X2 [Tyto alba]